MDCLMRIIIPILALVLFLYLLAVGAPDEAYGRVSKVVDGDTIDVTLQPGPPIRLPPVLDPGILR